MGRKVWWVAGALLCWMPSGTNAQSVNMGTTFHDLEGRAQRVVATFEDAEVETRRNAEGAWHATLRDKRGRVRAELRGQRGHRAVHFQPQGRPAEAQAFELAEATEVGLDWVALQAYATWTDVEAAAQEGRAFDPATAHWDGHVRRDGSARGRAVSAGQLASRLQRVRTEFPDIVVTAGLDEHRRDESKRRVDYSKFTARVTDRTSGRDKGFVRWFDTAQVLTWKVEGGGEGVILPERMRGGWTFTPTMAWANVQAYYFATRPQHLDPEAPFAQRLGDLFARPATASALGQVAWLSGVPGVSRSLPWRTVLPAFGGVGLAAAALAFNEPGCDNLHWLDHSIFRVCCDRHDRCYEKSGCSASSWRWPFSGTWQCATCNAQVVWCFCTLANPYHCGGSGGSGGGGDDSGTCERTSGGFCPVTCSTCIAS